MATSRVSFGSICDTVETYTGNVVASNALAYVIRAYERVLAGVDPRDPLGNPHAWSFLQPVAELTLAALATGTATGVYSATTEQTTITATTAIFGPAQVGDTITVADVGDLKIVDYTSPTVVVAEGGEDFEAKGVSLPHSGIYDLPATWGGMAEDPVYPVFDGEERPRLERVTLARLAELWREYRTAAGVIYYAVGPVTLPDGTAQTYQMRVAPRPDQSRVLLYRYVADLGAVTAPTDAADKYPLGPARMGPLLRAAALADAELMTGHVEGPLERRYREAMVGAILADKALTDDDDPAPRMD